MLNKNLFAVLNNSLAVLKEKFKEENIFGIFLYGEENAVAAVLVPTFEDVCLNKTLLNEVYKNIKIIDVRYIYHATRDGFPEIIESLYTDYYIVNPRYEHIYNKLFRANRELFSKGIAEGSPPEELKQGIMKIIGAVFKDNSAAVRFLKQLTDVEKTAIENIIAVVGDEGTFSQAKVASAAGISRIAMSNLVLKMQLSGVALIEYMGNKGTYIKILDNALLRIRE